MFPDFVQLHNGLPSGVRLILASCWRVSSEMNSCFTGDKFQPIRRQKAKWSQWLV